MADQLAEEQAKSRRPRLPVEKGKVDPAGRLKLPASYKDYLLKTKNSSVFITLNEGIAQIYTYDAWDRNIEIAQNCGDSSVADRLSFLADVYGAPAELDDSGRITLPQELRRKLGLADQPVQLRFFEDVIKIYKQGDFDAAVAVAENMNRDDLAKVKPLGWK